jgi:hypothetical protein
MKKVEDIIMWMVKQMELSSSSTYQSMPVEIEEELTPPEYLSAKESPSQEH